MTAPICPKAFAQKNDSHGTPASRNAPRRFLSRGGIGTATAAISRRPEKRPAPSRAANAAIAADAVTIQASEASPGCSSVHSDLSQPPTSARPIANSIQPRVRQATSSIADGFTVIVGT